MMKHILRASALLALLAQPALADITLRFQEGAPKDRFVISSDTCPLQNVDVLIDLDGSAGGLIFDVTSAGAGVEVFQPVEIQNGAVTAQPVVDGDQQLTFRISSLRAAMTSLSRLILMTFLPTAAWDKSALRDQSWMVPSFR